MIGFVVLLAASMSLGMERGSSGGAINEGSGLQWLWAVSGSFLLILPLLASASRMVGSYRDQKSSQSGGGA